MKKWGYLFSVFLFAVGARAELRIARIFTDGAVLQRRQPVPVWGWTVPGKTVTVSFHGNQAGATAGADGKWMTFLPAMEANASGSNLVVSASGETSVTLTNVVVGEVWLCTGQSNMARDMKTDETKGYTNRTTQIAAANYPTVRFFLSNWHTSENPLEDFDMRRQYGVKWLAVSPATVPDSFSLAYFFGKELNETLGVPVGLIEIAVSGTDIKSWTECKTLVRSYPQSELLTYVQEYWSGREAAGCGSNVWPGIIANWESQWDKAYTNGTALPNWPGVDQSPATLHNGPSELYNALVRPVAPYGIRGNIWFQGEGSLADGGGRYLNTIQAMIEQWRSIWNSNFFFIWGQIAPAPPAIGTVFQSEPVNSGRQLIMEDFLRARLLGITNTAMTVNQDLFNHEGGMPDSVITQNGVHFEAKDKAGHRMALVARARCYGETNLVWSGPLYTNMIIEGSQIRLQFACTGGGLELRGTGQRTNGFAIASAPYGTFYYADAVVSGNEVIVSNPALVPSPKAVRYTWHPYPMVSLYNAEGLPSSPFRTDLFPTNSNQSLNIIVATNRLVLNEGTTATLAVRYDNVPDQFMFISATNISGSGRLSAQEWPVTFTAKKGTISTSLIFTAQASPGFSDATATFRLMGRTATGGPVDIEVVARNTNTYILPPEWIRQYTNSTLTNLTESADTDGDGFSNWQEYLSGTNPTNAQSRLFLSRREGQATAFDWLGASGRVYNVYWSTNLLNGFTLLRSNVNWNASSFTGNTDAAEGFYRLEATIPD